MSCAIVPATLLDLSYIAANLCPADRAEIECQVDEWDAAGIAAYALRDFAFCALWDGNPEAGFGCGRAREGYWIAWSWGTVRAWRCLPDMIAFIRGYLQPLVYEAGARRVEARALASHVRACRFLERISGQRRCLLPSFGKNGEDFVLYDWTRESWDERQQQPSTKAAMVQMDGLGTRCFQ